MLLVVDVGNTQTHFGTFAGDELVEHWRFATVRTSTADELGAALRSLLGLRASVLAAITEIESSHGCNMGPSSAGAIGWTQFMPGTWKMWGMDADGDRKASPHSSVDAIFSTARYLRASGAPRSYRKALFAYNHATWYVNKVLARAKAYQ